MRILNAQETKQVSGGVTIPGFGGNWGGPTTIPVEPTTPNAPSGAGAGSNGAPAPTNSTQDIRVIVQTDNRLALDR